MTGDQFGRAVDLDGDTLAVGASGKGNGGGIFVYRNLSSTWMQEACLVGSQTVSGDGTGEVLALSGDTVVCGVFRKHYVWEQAGIVYVFVRDGTTWSEQALLPPPNVREFGWFGYSVAIEGDLLVVGARQTGFPHDEQGYVEVFRRSGTQWTHTDTLTASDAAPFDHFGDSVDLEGNTLIVGAGDTDDACPTDPSCDTGAVYVFEWTGSEWQERAKLTASDGDKDDRMGQCAAISADILVAGAQWDDDIAPSSGAAYVFRRSGSDWVEEKKLVPLDGGKSQVFGTRLAVDDETALVFGCSGEWNSCSGGVYTYLDDGGSWPLSMKMLAPNPTRNYGGGLAIQGETVCIGARGEVMGSMPYVGAVFIYRTTPGTLAPTVYCTAKSNSCGTMPAIRIAGIPSATSGGGLFVTASEAPTGKSGLLLYTDTGRATLPFQGGTLCVEPSNLSRSPPVMDSTGTGGCDGELSIDMNAFAAGSLGGTPQPFLLVPGTHVNAQFWGRDEVTTGNLLSDAVEWAICP